MSVTQQTVVTCDHTDCPQTISREVSATPTDAAWLDSSGWLQFKAKKKVGSSVGLAFCPTHFADLRLFFGPMSAEDELVLSQGKAV